MADKKLQKSYKVGFEVLQSTDINRNITNTIIEWE